MARESEEAEISRNVLTKWKKKPASSLMKSRVITVQPSEDDNTQSESTPKDGKASNGKGTGNHKRTWAKILHIPEKYLNNKAQFVDVISRVFFPASFMVFNIVFWAYYH